MPAQKLSTPALEFLSFAPSARAIVASRSKQISKLIGSGHNTNNFISHLRTMELHRLPYLAHMILNGDARSVCGLLFNYSALSTLISTSATTCRLVQDIFDTHSGDGRVSVFFKNLIPAEQEMLYLRLEEELKEPGLEAQSTYCWVSQSDQDNKVQGHIILSPILPMSGVAISNKGAIATMFLNGDQRFSLLNNTELPYFINKMCSAELAIYSLWPEFFTLFKQFITVVVPAEIRMEVRSRVVRYGASRKDLPGAIFMNDYHRPEISVAELCENLIHETVHNLLFMLEEVQPWFKNSSIEQLIQTHLPSPWSTRNLPVYSFFHSLIVFRAVAQWTERCQNSDIFSEDQISKEYIERQPEKLADGFLNARITCSNSQITRYLTTTGKSILQAALTG